MVAGPLFHSSEKTIIVDQIETCKQMALHGIGYAILPSISLREADAFHQVPLHNKNGEQMKRDTWMICHGASLELKQVEAFVKLVKED